MSVLLRKHKIKIRNYANDEYLKKCENKKKNKIKNGLDGLHTTTTYTLVVSVTKILFIQTPACSDP